MLQTKRSPVSAWRWERVWYIVELRLETRPRQITQSPENPNERFGLYLWAEGNHGTVFRNGNSGSNLHVRRTVLVKNVLVINKKLKQKTKKMIQEVQHIQGKEYCWISQRSGTRNGYQYQVLFLGLPLPFPP